MKMRIPLVPLITADPYFSVWSRDAIRRGGTVHWTGSPDTLHGTVDIDGEVFSFLGCGAEPIKQVSLDTDAMSTCAVFENGKIRLTAVFTSPLLITDLYYVSRPVSYLKLSYESLDGIEHKVTAKVTVTEELVLNKSGEGRAYSEDVPLSNGTAVRIGSGAQQVLNRSGDDVRIDWGYCYLAVKGAAVTRNEAADSLYAVSAQAEIKDSLLFAFAYDDISSLIYFGEPVNAYWKKDGRTITGAIEEALDDYDEITRRCREFSASMYAEAKRKGGEKYAELLTLAYRQVMAAHKLAADSDGNVIFISKECFSNGCAATVDVTYPSAPLFLRYNTELLKGMLRPIIKYCRSGMWKHDFAPHDVGQYPILNGQVYGAESYESQMPVEECGNMLILAAAVTRADGNTEFADSFSDLLEMWSGYLVKYGLDPDYQLCTDDFAGHMAHNCNLSLKAVMGLAGYADILRRRGETGKAGILSAKAAEYGAVLTQRAANSDGSFRLAYDRPDTFSLKYNAVWDKLWKTGLFPDSFFEGETARYRKEALPYGVPLDSREKYTKSDWTAWIACFSDKPEDFEFFVSLLWNAYNTMRSRVPMTDWYYADTSEMVSFRNRTVQGGLFIKLLFD